MIVRHNERWIVLGDVTNSTEFLYALTHTLEGQKLFEITSHYNALIESMYRTVEHYAPETSTLINTMGDGFLVAGMAGHGTSYIQYEFPGVLQMCYSIKEEVDKYLIQETKSIKTQIEEQTKNQIKLPNLRLKLCVDYGHILTSIGFNRYIGDCINYSSRILSVAFPNEEENSFVLTRRYFGLLPNDIQDIARRDDFTATIEVTNYPRKGDKTTEKICKIPLNHSDFRNILERYLYQYLHDCNLTNGMGKLSKELYERGQRSRRD